MLCVFYNNFFNFKEKKKRMGAQEVKLKMITNVLIFRICKCE